MKKRNTVLILGISSILILISVQIFIILGIWKQKNETVCPEVYSTFEGSTKFYQQKNVY